MKKTISDKLEDFNRFLKINIGLEIEFLTFLEETKLLEKLREIGIEVEDVQPIGYHKKFENKTILRKKWHHTGEFYELVLEPSTFEDAISKCILVLNLIREIGETYENHSLHFSVSHKEETTALEFINIFMLSSKLDEEGIYSAFPQRKNSIYARPLLQNLNFNYGFHISNVELINRNNIKFKCDKTCGVNLMNNDRIEFRYIGGEDYHKRIKDIIRIIKTSSLIFLDSYNDYKVKAFSDDLDEYDKSFIEAAKNKSKAFITYSDFKKFYPNINLMFNMDSNKHVVLANFHKLVDIYEWFPPPGKWKFDLNFDSDLNIFQISGAYLMDAIGANTVEFFDSTLKGTFYNCRMQNCTVRNSQINTSTVNDSTVKYSKVVETYVNYGSKVEKSELKKCELLGKVDDSLILFPEKSTVSIAELGQNNKMIKE